MFTIFCILVLISFILLWIGEYSKIQLYDTNTIYIGPDNEEVVVLRKNPFIVTISYIDKEPLSILFYDFITNFKQKE